MMKDAHNESVDSRTVTRCVFLTCVMAINDSSTVGVSLVRTPMGRNYGEDLRHWPAGTS